MQILVTGGAGYIGSHMVRMLVGLGHKVFVVDSLEFGHRQALPQKALFVDGNLTDRKIIKKIFAQTPVDAVIHFAGYISMEESVRDPRKYLTNNLITPLTLLEVMKEYGVKSLIFSSTAGVYGDPLKLPIPEDHPKNPLNPYGLSKLAFEQLLNVYSRQNSIRSISLRYFNAAGASLNGVYGEDHQPETHIIPLAIATALGKQTNFKLYGSDYPTRDGTCVRDYIHVEDLCLAHLVTLEALLDGHETAVYNVGTGVGITNLEVITQIKRESGINFPVSKSTRRPGDAAELVADSTKLQTEFGWKPKYSDLGTIVKTAWMWHSQHPDGYTKRITSSEILV